MGARGTGGRRPSNTKSAAKARLLKAWRNQHKGKARGSEVADAMQGAFDVGMTQNEIDSVMDRASGGKSFNVGRVGEPGYRNRSGTAKPRPYGTDRDRFHGNPNARKSRNRSGSDVRKMVQRLIDQSRVQNRIVTVNWSPSLETELRRRALDYVDAGNEVVEFWGGKTKATLWRIHLKRMFA